MFIIFLSCRPLGRNISIYCFKAKYDSELGLYNSIVFSTLLFSANDPLFSKRIVFYFCLWIESQLIDWLDWLDGKTSECRVYFCVEGYLVCSRGHTPAGKAVLEAYLGFLPLLPALVVSQLATGGEVFHYPTGRPLMVQPILQWLQRVEDGEEPPAGMGGGGGGVLMYLVGPVFP